MKLIVRFIADGIDLQDDSTVQVLPNVQCQPAGHALPVELSRLH